MGRIKGLQRIIAGCLVTALPFVSGCEKKIEAEVGAPAEKNVTIRAGEYKTVGSLDIFYCGINSDNRFSLSFSSSHDSFNNPCWTPPIYHTTTGNESETNPNEFTIGDKKYETTSVNTKEITLRQGHSSDNFDY